MAFELIPGWTPEEPAPVALCDNPACLDPIMPADGWAIAALAPPDPTRSARRRATRTYLACGADCLAAVRKRVGGDWSAPVLYGVYWRAIAPRVAEGRAPEVGEEARAAVAAAEEIVRAYQHRSRR